MARASEKTVDRIAGKFHLAYEAFAVLRGYETRRASAVAWDEVPEQNKTVMHDTVRWLLIQDDIRVGSKRKKK